MDSLRGVPHERGINNQRFHQRQIQVTTILHIDASVRGSTSLSRKLSRTFVEAWLSARPDDTVLRRDVGLDPPPFVTETWIAAAFTRPDDRTDIMRRALAASDRYISELERADLIVIGTPMYNYGMPAQLKAWIDQVIRVDRTFSFDLARGDWPLQPILKGKDLVLLTSSGEFGFEPGGVRETMNHLDTHIRTCSHYLGVAHTHHIGISYQEFGGTRHEQSVANALAETSGLVQRLLTTSCTVYIT
jgi:FMN-dependent NADH-azoreductase